MYNELKKLHYHNRIFNANYISIIHSIIIRRQVIFMKKQTGLLIVHTGNGKGKTTAALGLAVRAWGQGLKILILQFIKGGWKYGELKALEKFSPELEIRPMGQGFTQKANNEEKEQHRAAAQATVAEAKTAIQSGAWDMVILDEINYAVKFELIGLDDVLVLLDCKPESLHLVLTGRDARQEIIDRADLVTEMKEIKHPYQQGIKAQAGIEF